MDLFVSGTIDKRILESVTAVHCKQDKNKRLFELTGFSIVNLENRRQECISDY